MRNPKKRPILSSRKTAFLLIFSMLLSVFTVIPSFAEGSGGEVNFPIRCPRMQLSPSLT